ncbi:unnamed protein product [Calypogeia fissa]
MDRRGCLGHRGAQSEARRHRREDFYRPGPGAVATKLRAGKGGVDWIQMDILPCPPGDKPTDGGTFHLLRASKCRSALPRSCPPLPLCPRGQAGAVLVRGGATVDTVASSDPVGGREICGDGANVKYFEAGVSCLSATCAAAP